MEVCIKIKSIMLDFVFQRFNSDCALCCGCMVLCRSLLFLPKKPTPTSLLLGNMNNGHSVMIVATGDACLPLLLYLCAGHVVKILGT
jgi:hypothetical protein